MQKIILKHFWKVSSEPFPLLVGSHRERPTCSDELIKKRTAYVLIAVAKINFWKIIINFIYLQDFLDSFASPTTNDFDLKTDCCLITVGDLSFKFKISSHSQTDWMCRKNLSWKQDHSVIWRRVIFDGEAAVRIIWRWQFLLWVE